jgi:hypothetical protein
MEISPFVDDPNERVIEAEQIRRRAAKDERNLGVFPHPTNGDEELYPDRIGNFSKGLRHNDLGEVEPTQYDALLDALRSGDFNDFEALQLGSTKVDGKQISNLRLFNPLGGLVFNIEGPDSPATTVNPPPAFASPEIAGQMAELYWMAVCRDVPFSNYNSDPTIAAAASDLATFPGYEDVTPQTLFRVSYPGVKHGPIVSQFLLLPFRYDGISIEARTRVPQPVTIGNGIDFLTSYEEWLCAQRGFPRADNPFDYPFCQVGQQRFDAAPRFIRSVRDMGQNAAQDSIYSAFFRAALILNEINVPVNENNPYKESKTQRGFSTFGLAHLLMLVGSVHKAERHTWYQKWNVHRFLRPEAFGGRVHNNKVGDKSYPIDASLLSSPVLDRIFEYNKLVNQRRGIGGGEGTFLLPILLPTGSPTHPSFPAGHAFSAGACVTILKAWFEDVPLRPLVQPVKPNREGTALEPYIEGVDGPALTIHGELNKLAHNLSLGRDMSGVHWRADDIEGDRNGEEVAIRILREARATYPEPFKGFTFTKFDGSQITV